MPHVEKKLPDDGVSKIAIGLFHQQHISITARIAQINQLVGIAPLIFKFGGEAQP